MDERELKLKKTENIPLGIIGAFLLSLIGGALWFILYQLGFFVELSGIVLSLCAYRGYVIFSKGSNPVGLLGAALISVGVLLAAWFLSINLDVYEDHVKWYIEGVLDAPISYVDALEITPRYLADDKLTMYYLKPLIGGVALALIIWILPIKNAFSKVIRERKERHHQAEEAPCHTEASK